MSSNSPPQTPSNRMPNTTLCLACSSSLPPRLLSSVHITPCCSKPICPSCISTNPRLTRYNPCLLCLGGVGVVGSSAIRGDLRKEERTNVDGGVEDEDVFVLGDEEGDEGDKDESSPTPPPAYSSPPHTPLSPTPPQPPPTEPDSPPTKYYIKPSDTLLGIALKFGIDGRTLCRLNTLPFSTLTTTPHILHTRSTLLLRPSLPPTPSDLLSHESRVDNNRVSHLDKTLESKINSQKSLKRFQLLTKEVDVEVARVYLSLANPNHSQSPSQTPSSELPSQLGSSAYQPNPSSPSKRRSSLKEKERAHVSPEESALGQYLDDAEWEERERKEGRGVVIPRFPLGSASSARGSGSRGGDAGSSQRGKGGNDKGRGRASGRDEEGFGRGGGWSWW
ncbi:hypothetical protein JAAARDRAFT_192612 [Jaapia argillacea MUCL 33604]|uniref:LysM domain-containing protein n=1 Tax=Jaapia argillacea MUCL 33604 TaxID=933084 RepID=A0A067PW58_9AGAM|nr:hypothetical protein JAAARDRAFT_192612 [Jaapia argillacea MUCL 33604]